MGTNAKDLAANTPVIIGVGFAEERDPDPTKCSEPYVLMVDAIRAAASDAGADALPAALDSITVTQGIWNYRNPVLLIAGELGCPNAKSIVSDLGVLQLTVVNDLCLAIASGEQSLGVVVGGEAKFRELRSTVTQQPVAETFQSADTPSPDVRLTSLDPFCSDLESRRGFSSATDLFAVLESALRYSEGLGVEAHRDELARLYSSFSEIAARNPHAWRREPVAPETIRNASPKNAMQAFPYTKLHCSQWNVNQAVAILVCSAARARELGLDESRWIYPLSTAVSKHVVVPAQQRTLGSRPGTVIAGKRALELAGVSRDEVGAAELYSCFPAAIRSFAKDLDLEDRLPLTVTGAMAFAGGPFNHASLAGLARMVEVLRGEAVESDGTRSLARDGRRVGLVSNLSGVFGKQACALYSNVPNPTGYRYEDVTESVAKMDVPVPLDADYVGPATIAGYTVVFVANEPSHALAICDTPGGKRTVVRSEDKELLARLTREEFCGRRISVLADGSFTTTTAVS